MTTPPNDDWSDLTRTWTDRPAAPPRLDPNLVRAVRRRDLLARLNFVGELAGGVVTIGIVIWATLVRDLPWTLGLTALGFVAFALAGTLWSRRGDPGLLTGTPEAVLGLGRRGHQSGGLRLRHHSGRAFADRVNQPPGPADYGRPAAGLYRTLCRARPALPPADGGPHGHSSGDGG
jgi:hypothetical protein